MPIRGKAFAVFVEQSASLRAKMALSIATVTAIIPVLGQIWPLCRWLTILVQYQLPATHQLEIVVLLLLLRTPVR